ncbi:MAG: hypothetical protein LBD88_03965 [Candidatus Peribacteria bacterium]|jgi:hypothetical protein|nr:hypothetical protein [Candidatus Peribacteria bacterium]
MEEFQKLQKIMETKDLYICKLITREVSLNDSINFYALINGLKDRKLLSKNIIEKIDYCRKMRNLIHVSVMLTSEYKLIDELTKAFIYAKEIIDYVKIDLEKSQKVKD